MLGVFLCIGELDKLRINCIQSLLFVHGLLWLNFIGPAHQRLILGRSRTSNLCFWNLLCPNPCLQNLSGSFVAKTRIYKMIARWSIYLCSWQVDSQIKHLWRSSSPIPQPKKGHLVQVIQEHIRMGFEHLHVNQQTELCCKLCLSLYLPI